MKRIAVLACALTLGGECGVASTRFDQFTWADGPIRLTIDTSGAAAATVPPEALRSAIVAAMGDWNRALGVELFQPTTGVSTPGAVRNGRNEITFQSQIAPGIAFGGQFGAANLRPAVTGRTVEADLVFNPAQPWTVYPGPLQYDGQGNRIAEMRRVALHELGHLLGIGHSTSDTDLTIMRPRMSDLESLQPVDRANARRVAAFLARKNQPRLMGAIPREVSGGRLHLRGGANPFFVRRIEIRVETGTRSRTYRVRADRRWTRTLTLPAGASRVRCVMVTPLVARPLTFASAVVRSTGS